MEDQISQSFKVQWINTTLKYLKDDKQLIMKYSDMPVDHMEYLHNLIRGRKHGVELGFKSMYAPVWEAMKIFGLKYKFKVTVNKSEDGEKGHLVIEKIPKRDQENMEPAKTEKLKQANVTPDYPSTDSDDEKSESSQSQLDSQISTGARKKKPTKTKEKNKTNSEKFFIDKQKIIESISPVLLRKALKDILDFLLKKEEASIIFSDLAPVEAKFLENFLGIYNKRLSFRDSLSPACNALLDKMCEFFKEFDKQCKLEVYAAKYNVHTQYREVTFMKVPRYTRTNANQSQKQIVAPQMIAKHIQSVSLFKNNAKIPKPILCQTIVNSNLKITIPNEKSDAIGTRAVKLSVNKENGEEKSNNRDEKTCMNRENGEEKLGENKLNENNTKAENSDAISNKEVKSINDTKDNKLTESIKITDDKLVVLNKELLKQEIEEITIPKDTSKTIIPVKKMDNPPIAHNRIRDRCFGTRKEKLLEAMSTPLESDKAMRMMHLMGWQGGALGVRGEGIIEPIIPALDIVRGKGLGHVKGNPIPTKPVKSVKPVKSLQNKQKPVNEPQVEEKPAPAKPVKPNVRVENRTRFLKTVLDLINKDMSITAVTYSVELCKKEKKCYNSIVYSLNRRMHHSLTEPENLIVAEITRRMVAVPEMSLDLSVTADLKELTITKMLDSIEDTRPHSRRRALLTEREDSQNSKINNYEDMKFNRKMTKSDFKRYICSTVLDFLKSSATERWIDFDATLTEKYCKVVDTVCYCVNKKVKIPFKPARDIAREIMEIDNKCFLDVQFEGRPTRSFLLRKFYHRKPCINNEVLKQILQRYTDTVIPDKGGKNEHRDAEASRTNSDKETSKQNTVNVMSNKASHKNNPYSDKICERLNPRNDENKPDTTVSYTFIDSVRSSVVDDEDINENRLKTNEEKQCYDNLNINNHKVNDCKDISETSGKKINSNIKIELHDNDSLTTVHENNPFNTNDNFKCTESSKLSDKQDMSCELNQLTNLRKCYDHSEKFLMSDNLATSHVKTIDSNNNRNKEAHVERNKYLEEKVMNIHFEIDSSTHVEENHIKLDLDNAKIENTGKSKDDAMEVDLSNQDDEQQSLLDFEEIEGNDSQDFNPIGAYEGCRGKKDSIDVIELHQAGENQSVLVTLQEEANNNDEKFKPSSLSEDVIDNKTILDLIESKISDKIETHSKLDVTPIYRDNNEILNNISVSEVRASDIGVNESYQSHREHENHSELDIVETAILSDGLNDFGKVKSPHTDDVTQVKIHNEDDLSDYETINSYGSPHTNRPFKLDKIQEESDYKEHLTLIMKNPADNENETPDQTHSTKDKVVENSIKDNKVISITDDFESPKEDERYSKYEISKIETDCNVILCRNDNNDSDESFEAVEVKHKFSSDYKTLDLESKNTLDKLNSILDTAYNCFKQTCGNQTKDLNNTNTEIDRTDDVVLIESNILEVEVIQEKKQNSDESFEAVEVKHKLCINKEDYSDKEDLRLTNDYKTLNLESKNTLDKLNSILDTDYNCFEHTCGNQTKDLNNTNTEIDRTDDVVLIESNILEVEVIQEKIQNSDESFEAVEVKHKLCINKEDYSDKEDLRLTNDYKTLDLESKNTLDKLNSILDTDYNCFEHTCGNQTKALNNTNTEIDRTYDVVLIESNILEVEVIQKKIQNKIESIDPEVEFLPLLKYHGILSRGLVYSCHNKESGLWLRNILPNYSVIDYKNAISNHKLKIKVASLNKDAKKFLGSLEIYNQGLNSRKWNIISEKHYNYSLILCVEVDSDSFEYICDKNFSLFVGYDVAQFSIGC